MLGRKNYTREEFEHGKAAIKEQVAVYKKETEAIANEKTDKTVTGNDSNPLNEVELICDSLMNNSGILRGNNVIKYIPDQSVVNLKLAARFA